MRHKHYNYIVSWAEGKQIQERLGRGAEWKDVGLNGAAICFSNSSDYRIKPEPKPDSTRWAYLKEAQPWSDRTSQATLWTETRCPGDNLKATFDGETGQLKSVEIVK